MRFVVLALVTLTFGSVALAPGPAHAMPFRTKRASTEPLPKGDAHALYRQGQALRDSDPELSLACFQSAASAGLPAGHKARGLLLSELGRKREAISALKSFLQLAPRSPDGDYVRDIIVRLGGTP